MSNRIIKEGWLNFKRNSYLSIAAIGIMSMTLALLVALLAFRFMTTQVVTTLESKVDITAYFETTVSEAAILDVKADLEALGNVQEVIYTSQEQAKADFLQRRGEDAEIRESFEIFGDENPLLPSLNIRAQDPSQYEAIGDFLRDPRFDGVVNKVDDLENKLVIDRVQSISSALNTWGLVTAIALGVMGVFVAFNTIRLTIYSQKQEIEIMRLVGASNWQIRGPYVMEGGLYGGFAGLIALAIMYPIVYAISDNILLYTPEINLFDYFISNALQVIIIVLVVGVILGMISSAIAIRKHLKV